MLSSVPVRMKINGIAWLQDVIEKIHRKHGVEPDEVEDVLGGDARMRRIEAGHVRGEDLYVAAGRTRAARYLLVFFVHKRSGEALIVSAREMTRREKRRYGKS